MAKYNDSLTNDEYKLILEAAFKGPGLLEKEELALVEKLERRTANIKDVIILVRSLTKRQKDLTEDMLDIIQIQHNVLIKMGATEKMFADAEKEYNDTIEARKKEMQDFLDGVKGEK